jgi:hypothetical protein
VPLILRPTGLSPRPDANDWTIHDDGMMVGRIYEDHAAHLPEGRWFWALREAASDDHQAGVRTSGRAATLAGAKTAFRASYEAWLTWPAARRQDSDSGKA